MLLAYPKWFLLAEHSRDARPLSINPHWKSQWSDGGPRVRRFFVSEERELTIQFADLEDRPF
jgi:hypothetical protein